MNVERWVEATLQDEECKTKYEEYLLCIREKRKKNRREQHRTLVLALLCTAVGVWLLGGLGLLAFPLICLLAFLEKRRRGAPVNLTVGQSWNESGRQIIANAISACFQDGQLVFADHTKHVFRNIIRADHVYCTMLFSGLWRGKCFRVCSLYMTDERVEQSDITLFDGMLLEVEARPTLHDLISARLGTWRGYEVLPDMNYGVASAAALILFVIILIVTMINSAVSKRSVHY